jgi:DNA (cytosine-5)-methyltransferase 1
MNQIVICGLLSITDLDKNRRVYCTEGIAPALTTMTGGNTKPKIMEEKTKRIRRLTPGECWKLMGFTSEDYERAKSVNSESQLYKQAGNSICVPVLESIFRQMLP